MQLRDACVVFALAGLAACAPPSDAGSGLKVTNGVEIDESDTPAVVRLDIDTGQGTATCTGTFVSDTTLITAAHCVDKIRGLSAAGAQASRWFMSSTYDGRDMTGDVAIAIFPAGTGKTTMPLADRPPAAGDQAMLIGYGCNDMTSYENCTGAGTRRKGQNSVLAIESASSPGRNAMIQIRGASRTEGQATGTGANVGRGDSGGPLVINGKIAGIASHAGEDIGQGATFHAYYANVHADQNLAFLQSAVQQGASIPGIPAQGVTTSRPSATAVSGGGQGPTPPGPTPPGPTPPGPTPPGPTPGPGDIPGDVPGTKPPSSAQCMCGPEASGQYCAVVRGQAAVAYSMRSSSDPSCQSTCQYMAQHPVVQSACF